MQKNGILGAKTYTNPTSYTLSYTLSYTRKCLRIQAIWGMGVGNVGYFPKTFGSASIWVIDIFLHVLAWLINLSDNQHIN